MEMPITDTLQSTSDIFIKPVPENTRIPFGGPTFLLMGPTGAGKSSFIEALGAPTQNLGLSKDQLAGYTQKVTAYELVGEGWLDRSIYLADTPGFSDSKISELEIIDMARAWMEEAHLAYVDAILFLTPISEPRLAGSKRRTIAMLKALLHPTSNLGSIIFVTTMWDQLHNERTRQRAESNFSQLRDTILKEFIDAGAVIEKFSNTRDSALQILSSYHSFASPFLKTPETQAPLYLDLHDRIECALLQKKVLESELASPETQSNPALKSIFEQNHRENEETLAKFIGQLDRFGQIPSALEDTHQGLQKAIQVMQKTAPEVNERAPFCHDDPHVDDDASTHTDAAPLSIVIAAEAQPTPLEGVTPPPPQPVVEVSPTSLIQVHPTRMLILKGLLRRLVRAAKRRGKKWSRTSKD